MNLIRLKPSLHAIYGKNTFLYQKLRGRSLHKYIGSFDLKLRGRSLHEYIGSFDLNLKAVHVSLFPTQWKLYNILFQLFLCFIRFICLTEYQPLTGYLMLKFDSSDNNEFFYLPIVRLPKLIRYIGMDQYLTSI